MNPVIFIVVERQGYEDFTVVASFRDRAAAETWAAAQDTPANKRQSWPHGWEIVEMELQ